MKLTIISDTHNQHDKIEIEKTDVLIHCGDSTNTGTLPEMKSFLSWFEKQDAKYKIFIAGNHDIIANENKAYFLDLVKEHKTISYLEHSSLSPMLGLGLNIFGSPFHKKCHDGAFPLDNEFLKKKWNEIPSNIDILITHIPPFKVLDLTNEQEYAGCVSLKYKVMNGIKPKLHCFGHIHEGYGIHKFEDTIYVNASSCNRSHKPINKPITIEL